MTKLPRLAVVGPMVGKHFGCVTTQGEILAAHFSSSGYPVVSVSSAYNRYLRLADIFITLIRKKKEVDIQCLQVFGGPSFVVEDIASFIGRMYGQKIIMVLRGGAFPEFMERFPSWSQRVLRRAHVIVAPSAFLARLVEKYGFKCRVIPNIIRLSEYPFRLRQQPAPHLFWMRAFHPIYNPEMAVRVFAQVKKKMPVATLVMAGQDKGQQAAVQQLCQSLGLGESVKFPGFLSMESKIKIGNLAEVFLNTNRVDNMPVSVVEACAMGLPVVATNVGGVPDLLTDGQTGLLVPSNDSNKMAEAVFRLLETPDLAERLSSNGRKLAERSSWEYVRTEWDNLFASIM
jgi:L-malate glycosyltransferase